MICFLVRNIDLVITSFAYSGELFKCWLGIETTWYCTCIDCSLSSIYMSRWRTNSCRSCQWSVF